MLREITAGTLQVHLLQSPQWNVWSGVNCHEVEGKKAPQIDKNPNPALRTNANPLQLEIGPDVGAEPQTLV